MTGFLSITHGPMFAGKTSHLIENINNYITFNHIQQQYPKILIINHSMDKRDINKIANLSTHNKFSKYNFPSYVETLDTEKLTEIDKKMLEKFEYLAIDECQFFPDLKEFVDANLKLGKYIHCSGLLADSDKLPFGQLYLLLPSADEITHLKAFCVYCKTWHKTAVFTKWIGDSEKTDKISVGAESKYVPVCGKHYY